MLGRDLRMWPGAVVLGVVVLVSMPVLGEESARRKIQAVSEWRGPEAKQQGLRSNPEEAVSMLNAEVDRLYEQAQYDEAIEVAERAFALGERELGPEHDKVLEAADNLAQLFLEKRNYARADLLYRRTLAVREKTLGTEHPDVARSLHGLARLSDAKGDYAEAEQLVRRALSIREKAFGPEHLLVAESLSSLAMVHSRKGRYGEEEIVQRRVLAIREDLLGAQHPDVAQTLNNLAAVYAMMGDRDRAVPNWQRALGILEKTFGPDDHRLFSVLTNLGGEYAAKDDYAHSELLLQRALGIAEKRLGQEHPQVAFALNNLAYLYYRKEDLVRAEPLYQLAFSIWEKTLEPGHPIVAGSLRDLAAICAYKGDYARATLMYERALAMDEKALGPTHRIVAEALRDVGRVHLAVGDTTNALVSMKRAAAIEEHNASILLTTGSDDQKDSYMTTLRDSTDMAVSLHIDFLPDAPDAKAHALTTILRRKGRVLDVMTDSLATVRLRLATPERGLFDELRSVTTEYSSLVWSGPGALPPGEYLARLEELDNERQELEAKLTRRSSEMDAALKQLTLEDVRKAVPAGSALVELFRYRPHNPNARTRAEKWQAPRYAVYILRHDGEIVGVDLGEAAPIDATASELLRNLGSSGGKPEASAQKLESLVMRPIRQFLGTTRSLLLSPDGPLNLVPFAALVDEEGHYLLERYSFTYLTTGRDLLRFESPALSRESPVVFAAPNFDSTSAPAPGGASRGERSTDIATLSYRPLTFVADEGRAIRVHLPGAKLVIGPEATEGAVKALHGPRLLHIATHGFFLPDQGPLRHAENPLLRSGLALAGFNKRKSGNDDGVLTALEASQLDLHGTKLVVLSACETGVGEAHSGDGVYGLRRAFVMAGAETQVMSLWKVDDKATRELMVDYYDRLLASGGRSEAMRQVQLAMLNRPERAHPYYWASFIVSGNPAALDGTPVTPDFSEVRPGMRGCSCEVGTGPALNAGMWVSVITLTGLLRLRRRSTCHAGTAAR